MFGRMFSLTQKRPGDVTVIPQAIEEKSAEVERVFEGYRRWGYLAADLDPLGFLTPVEHPELIHDGPAATAALKFYCGTIGVELFHIDDPELRRWPAERMESEAPQPDRAYFLERPIRAYLFEHVPQARHLDCPRFSMSVASARSPVTS